MATTWVGQKLSEGRYQVDAKLGEGGMGCVYRARDSQFNRDVVIKVPHPHMMTNADFAARFSREIGSLLQLVHPYIVKVLDVGEHAGLPFAVMRYLSGGSLRQRQAPAPDGQHLAQPPEHLSGWLTEVADALDFIHERGYIHRDVKPDNILFDADDHVFLSDFGVAKVLADQRPQQQKTVLTGTGVLVGTPRYLAPEFLREEPYDGRIDQYALAVTIYELLSGRPPFDGPSAVVIAQHMTQPAPPLHDVVPSISPELSAVVHQALAKDPARRFPTCGVFARAALVAVAPAPANATVPDWLSDDSGDSDDSAPPVQSPPVSRTGVTPMAMPLSQDYNEAIQTAAACFSDPELKQGEVVTNAMGLPMPCSGNFADVYAVTTPQRKWAVKCFTRQIPGLSERYVEISKYLQQVNLPFMVDFKFLEQGIRVRGDWQPILKMHWVEGFSLNEFVKKQLEKPHRLDILCQLWVKLATRLREANLAHCDLQHGNVLLVPGKKEGSLAVKLVDYDGMCVPALTLLKSIEVGHPNFQHPQRAREGIYNLEVDRFSHLVIYTALRALMVGGRALWQRYDNGDNLLFKQSDFEAPDRSPLFQELLQSNDPAVKALTETMLQALSKPLEQVPLLSDVATRLPTTKVAEGNTVSASTAEDLFAEATAGSPTGKKLAPMQTSKAGLLAVLAAGVLVLVGGVAAFVGMKGTETPQKKEPVVARARPHDDKPPDKPRIEPLDKKKEATPEPKPEPRPEPKPEPMPVPTPTPIRPIFLKDLKEFDVKMGPWVFGKGNIGNPEASPIVLDGVSSPNGLGMHPPDRGFASVKYKLEKGTSHFEAGVGLQVGGAAQSSVTFQVFGDGNLLWSSKPVRSGLQVQRCSVDVSRIDVLELRVTCLGSRIGAHAVWIEPRVLSAPLHPPSSDLSPEIPLVTNSIGMKLAPIPAGEFLMGSPDNEANRNTDEGPQHKVKITRPYYMGVYEVTQGQYEKVIGKNPSAFKDSLGHPVEQVIWAEAVEFCKKLSELPEEKKAGRIYRLPTEAEWEYACRAGTDTACFFDPRPATEYAWYNANSKGKTHSVGQLKPNPWGLYDLHGNVWEWCLDGPRTYTPTALNDPNGPEFGGIRVLRSGGWNDGAFGRRSAARRASAPADRVSNIGFRVLCEQRPEPITDSVVTKLALIPAGKFMMGSSPQDIQQHLKEKADWVPAQWILSEGPQHEVRITKPFYMGVHEVTVGQFRAFTQATNYKTQAEREGGANRLFPDASWKMEADANWMNPGFEQTDDHPVVCVSWNDAKEFCDWLSKKEGKTWRLPSEAEWEYACRAGTGGRFSCGDDRKGLATVANVAEASLKRHWPGYPYPGGREPWDDNHPFTAPVGQFKPNAFGLYDMHGNVWEWVADWYDSKYYEKSSSDDPKGSATGVERVRRGGSFADGGLTSRSAFRYPFAPVPRHSIVGFRVVCDSVASDQATIPPTLPTKPTTPEPIAAELANVPKLIDALKDGDKGKRHQAVQVLGKIGPKAWRAVPSLGDALSDKDLDVRKAAVAALGEMGPEAQRAVAKMIRALQDKTIHNETAAALVRMGKAAVPGLVEAVEDTKDTSLRLEIIALLGKMGPEAKDAVGPLTKILSEDKYQGVRQAAKSALAEIQRKK